MTLRFGIPIFAIIFVVLVLLPGSAQAQGKPRQEAIVIDTQAPTQPFPHYWERIFGSGRAVLALRDDYRRDLRTVKSATDMSYVRFHGILNDEVGVYSEDEQGNPVYNFSYVDQIFDGLLALGVRPFVELSFMPRQLSATPPVFHPFWYKPITSPPKDWKRWEDLISNLTRHLVERYGVDELSQWYFEVWNEPNIDFWAGEPKEATYYQLYDHTARAIKRVSPRLRVGGPATAQAAWVDRFIQHCVDGGVPVDFVSTHVYANDTSQDVFGTSEQIPRRDMVCRAVKKVFDQVKASARPDLPIEFTEYNASYKNEPEVTDSVFMGPWLANTIRECSGMLDNLAYWTFSDVFEEQGVVKRPFYGGFGLVAAGRVPKPSFNAFALLHRLGDKRIPLSSDNVLATRRPDGSLAIALWNYLPPGQEGAPIELTLRFTGLTGTHQAEIQFSDSNKGAVKVAYEAMGMPQYPTAEQLEKLREAAHLPPAQKRVLSGNQLELTLPPYGLALVEIH